MSTLRHQKLPAPLAAPRSALPVGSDDGERWGGDLDGEPLYSVAEDARTEAAHLDECLAEGAYTDEAAALREERDRLLALADLLEEMMDPSDGPQGMADQRLNERTLSQEALVLGARIGQVSIDDARRFARVAEREYARLLGMPDARVRGLVPSRLKSYSPALPSMPAGKKGSPPAYVCDELECEAAWGHTHVARSERAIDCVESPVTEREKCPEHWRPVVLTPPPRRTNDEALAEMRRDREGSHA